MQMWLRAIELEPFTRVFVEEGASKRVFVSAAPALNAILQCVVTLSRR